MTNRDSKKQSNIFEPAQPKPMQKLELNIAECLGLGALSLVLGVFTVFILCTGPIEQYLTGSVLVLLMSFVLIYWGVLTVSRGIAMLFTVVQKHNTK